MRVGMVCLVLLAGTPALALGQGTGQLLPPDARRGDRLTVTTARGVELGGRLVLDRAGTLVVRANGRDRSITHEDVVRVDRRRNRFLFGPLVGLGAGLALGLPLKRRMDNEGAHGNAALRWSVGFGVGLGAVVDLLNGSTQTIYSRGQAPRS